MTNAMIRKSLYGSETYGSYDLGKRRSRGDDLIMFYKINNLMISNTFLFTTQDPVHIVISRWKNPPKIVTKLEEQRKKRRKEEKILIGADCNSGHRLLLKLDYD